jgi:hypothetical protein
MNRRRSALDIRRIGILAAIGITVLGGTSVLVLVAPAISQVVHPTWHHQPPVTGRHLTRTKSARSAPAHVAPAPQAAPATVSQTAALGASGQWMPVGSSGLAVARAGRSTGSVSVQVLSASTAARLGLRGIALRINRPAGSAANQVAVSVPTSLLAGVYGTDFAGRAQWLQLSDCTTAKCAASRPLGSHRVAAVAKNLPAVAGTGVTTAAVPRIGQSATLTAVVPLTASSQVVTPMAATNAANGSGSFAARTCLLSRRAR